MHKLFPASLLILALTAPAQKAVGQAPMPMEPARPSYVTSAQVDAMKLLPPPPALQSEEQKRDLDDLLAIQKVRTTAQEQRALADATADTFGFADVLGPKFTAAALPKLAHLMDKVRGDGAAIENIGKDNWRRPRPFETSKEIQPVGNPPEGGSYPSGTSTVGYLTAIVLATREGRGAIRTRARGRLQSSRTRRALSDGCRGRTTTGDCGCNKPVSKSDVPQGFRRGQNRVAAGIGAVSDFFGADGLCGRRG